MQGFFLSFYFSEMVTNFSYEISEDPNEGKSLLLNNNNDSFEARHEKCALTSPEEQD